MYKCISTKTWLLLLISLKVVKEARAKLPSLLNLDTVWERSINKDCALKHCTKSSDFKEGGSVIACKWQVSGAWCLNNKNFSQNTFLWLTGQRNFRCCFSSFTRDQCWDVRHFRGIVVVIKTGFKPRPNFCASSNRATWYLRLVVNF